MGDWKDPNLMGAFPSTWYDIYTFSTDGKYEHKSGDCKNSENSNPRRKATYQIKGDQIILFYSNILGNYSDTLVIVCLKKDKLELASIGQTNGVKFNRCK